MEQTLEEPTESPEIYEEVVVPVVESTISTEEWVSEQAPVSESDDFVKRFSAIDPSIQHQLAMSRLETLIGSFGLNERLQFINELFDGSSEAFSDAIKSIDAQSDEQSALRKASNLATQFNWDHDSETVEEFVLKIKRRYA
jgi:Ca2+-binding EF-hand superfamily protein